MAERRGTGGRGGTGTLPEALDLEEFQAVPEAEEIDRSRTEASKWAPLIEQARANLGRQFERRPVVMENGEPKRDENGNVVRAPALYTGAEAKQFNDELRNAGNRAKLVKKGLSLRIVGSTPIATLKGDEQGVRVQWYVIRLQKSGQDTPQAPESAQS